MDGWNGVLDKCALIIRSLRFLIDCSSMPSKEPKRNPNSTRKPTHQQPPPSPMTLRSARIDSRSSSHSNNRKPTPTPIQKEKTKKTARKGPSAAQIISNVPDSESQKSKRGSSKSPIGKSGGKSPKKPVQTLTVQDVYRAEKTKEAKEAKEAPKTPSSKPHKGSNKRTPARTPPPKEEEKVVTHGSKRSKMNIEDTDPQPLSNFHELPRITSHLPSSAHKSSSPQHSSPSRQQASSGSEHQDSRMASRLQGLKFEHFQGLRLGEREKVVFEVIFREGNGSKKKQVDFSSAELAFLEKQLGQKFRFDFLQEYLIAHAQQ